MIADLHTYTLFNLFHKKNVPRIWPLQIRCDDYMLFAHLPCFQTMQIYFAQLLIKSSSYLVCKSVMPMSFCPCMINAFLLLISLTFWYDHCFSLFPICVIWVFCCPNSIFSLYFAKSYYFLDFPKNYDFTCLAYSFMSLL